jgi:hypothetical protein
MALFLIASRASTLFWRIPASIPGADHVFFKYNASISWISQE